MEQIFIEEGCWLATFRALISINGYDLPEPSTYKGNTSTLVNSGRNLQGLVIGAVIRDDIGKVEVTWNYLTVEQWANINKLFKKSAGGDFITSVTFFDQTIGDWTTRDMYVSDRSAGAWRRDPKTGELLGWTNCKLNLIEV